MVFRKPLISVIVPIFNAEQHLVQCLSSLAAQTYESLDILLVNDGSTDSSLDICQDYANRDKRCRVINRPNGGLSAARNTGIDNAQGEYLIFLDSDDYISPDHIESLYRLINVYGASVSVTNLHGFSGGEHTAMNCGFGSPELMSPIDALKTIFYQGKFDTCAPGKLYPCSFWKNVRFPIGVIHEDLVTIYKIFLDEKCRSVVFAPSDSYAYRFSPNGLNHSITTDLKADTLGLVKGVVDEVGDVYPELIPAARCFLVSFAFHLLLGCEKGSISSTNERVIRDVIISNRMPIIADGHARLKTRVACALSYFGWTTVQMSFRLMAMRGK